MPAGYSCRPISEMVDSSRSTPRTEVLGGLFAGIVGTTLGYPLDVTKVSFIFLYVLESLMFHSTSSPMDCCDAEQTRMQVLQIKSISESVKSILKESGLIGQCL